MPACFGRNSLTSLLTFAEEIASVFLLSRRERTRLVVLGTFVSHWAITLFPETVFQGLDIRQFAVNTLNRDAAPPMGSTRTARRTGIYAASSATAIIVQPPKTSAPVLSGFRSGIRLTTSGRLKSTSTNPAMSPPHTIPSASRNTRLLTSLGVGPRAIRMPTSIVRSI